MKYEYDVEYETNGEKPDLPDDVKLYINFMGDGMYMTYGEITMWGSVKSFRIVDERYKPKEQDMNNDWYDKGELPPVGSVVRITNKYSTSGEYHVVRIVAYTEQMVVFAYIKDGEESAAYQHNYIFEPHITETDKLVEQAVSDAEKHTSLIFTSTVEALINAGYRKIKPMSEDEFVAAATNFGVSGEGARLLFKRNCRFIDNGGDK